MAKEQTNGWPSCIPCARVHDGKAFVDNLNPQEILPDSVYLLDCLEGIINIKEESIDLIATDPPYCINYSTNNRKDKSHDFCSPIQNDNNPDMISAYMRECYRILKPNHACYMFCSPKTLCFFTEAAEKAHFTVKNRIVWVKNKWTAGDLKAQFGQQYEVILLLNKGRAPFYGKRIGDVWHFPRVAGNKQLHQNQKPLELMIQCIEKHSQEGDVVFDGFMGSGTTAVAAMRTGRRFIGFEIEPRYWRMTANRIEQEVEMKASEVS